MKQGSKNELNILNSIDKIHEHLAALQVKLDTLIQRLPAVSQPAKPAAVDAPLSARPNDRNSKGRQMYSAICADCKKECTIPFKPSGERPVYCKDCFSRRRVISMSGMKVADEPPAGVGQQPAPVAKVVDEPKKPNVKVKKKAVAVKKKVVKKKSAPKKK